MNRTQGQGASGWLTWLGVGCGLVVLLGLCVAFGAVAFIAFRKTAPEAPLIGNPEPVPTPPSVPSGAVPSEAPRQITAAITASSGALTLPVGTECRFDVVRVPNNQGTLWCNAQITCGTTLVYGGHNAGYFNCTAYEQPRRDVVGADEATTAQDNDPAMFLDTRAGTLQVKDDGRGSHGEFTLEARIVYVR